MHMHVEDHFTIERVTRSLPDGDAAKREVYRRLVRLSKYPTSSQVQTVLDQVVAEMKPPPQRARARKHKGSYVWK